MSISRQVGFTLIETMLFLAVTGVLTVAIMVTAGASIGAQRYKDAVATLQSDIQQQYEDATSIKNTREGISSIPACSGGIGQTDCVIMGKLMTVTSGGAIAQHVVYGLKPASISPTLTERGVIEAYGPAVVPSLVQNSRMEWGTHPSQAAPLDSTQDSGEEGWASSNVGILVVRSPRSGQVYTFTRNTTATNNLSSMVTTTAQARRVICVATTGWAVGDKMGISITANASSANAVEVLSNQMLSGLGIEC